METIITSAPEEYDGGTTNTIDWLPLKSNSGPLRRVKVDAEDLAWQRGH